MTPTHIILHHTALPYVSTTAAAVRRWQMEKRGYNDIAYHYLIREHRSVPIVEDGRQPNVKGAHCPPYNRRSLGVCVAGDWTAMDPAAYQRLWTRVVEHVQTLMGRHGIPVAHVLGHREAQPGHTECPGLRLDLDAFRALLEEP